MLKPPFVANKMTMCTPTMFSKGVGCDFNKVKETKKEDKNYDSSG